jgi:hypothetical protein
LCVQIRLRRCFCEGKRLPIVLRELGISTPTWSEILPEVKPIGLRSFARRVDPTGFVLKPVWGRIGEGVVIDGATSAVAARRARWMARLFPKSWCLQRKFESIPLHEEPRSVAGAAHQSPLCRVCIGVYVIDGRAAGAYARVAPRALMDGRAQDAAVLLDASLDVLLDVFLDASLVRSVVLGLSLRTKKEFQHASPDDSRLRA